MTEKELTEEMPDSPLYILTNRENLGGAAVIASQEVLRAVHGELRDDFYILPSSQHEVLICRKSDWEDVDALRAMVQTINRDSVSPADWLSDRVYLFDGWKLKLTGIEALKEEQSMTEMFKHRRYLS